MFNVFCNYFLLTCIDVYKRQWVHPRIAVRNARKLVNLNKKEEDIILKHMWGATIAPPKYKESYIVTMVDKYWAVKEAVTPLPLSLIHI